MIREHTDRLLADALFKNSQRYSNLLRFIVDRTLKGQTQDLKERVIGIEVFGRSPDYDTSVDPTVRVAANEVRKRLTNFYAVHDASIRIEIPVGTYVAEFVSSGPKTAIVPPPEAPAEKIPPEAPAARSHRKQLLIWGAVAAVLAALGIWLGITAYSPTRLVDRFWSPALNGPTPVLLCISTGGEPDPGDSQQGPDMNPSQSPSVPGQAATPPINLAVGAIDLNAINTLERYLRRKGRDFIIRPSKEVTLTDLRSGPAVLYGSYHNQWTNLLEKNLRFRFQEDAKSHVRWIADANNPSSTAWAIDTAVSMGETNHDFVLVTRALDTTTGRWWIAIGGLSGWGTIDVNQTLLDADFMSKLSSSLPRDWDKKNLQIVFALNLVNGSAGVPRVVTTQVW